MTRYSKGLEANAHGNVEHSLAATVTMKSNSVDRI